MPCSRTVVHTRSWSLPDLKSFSRVLASSSDIVLWPTTAAARTGRPAEAKCLLMMSARGGPRATCTQREKRTHSRNTSMVKEQERERESFALLLHEDDALILRIVLVCCKEAGEKLQQRVALARH